MMKKSKNNISGWLIEHGDPEVESFINKNLAIVEKVRLAMEAKGWKLLDLAKEMGKSPSEVSKWLSGMHNLTLKSLVKMERALDACLTHTEPVEEYEYVYVGTIKNTEPYYIQSSAYQQSTESEVFKIVM